MTLTLLTIAGIAVAATAMYVLASKSQEVGLASDNTVVGLSDAAEATIASGRHLTPASRTDWRLTTVTALRDAEELLDMLEFQGYAERELIVLGNASFTVRWR